MEISYIKDIMIIKNFLSQEEVETLLLESNNDGWDENIMPKSIWSNNINKKLGIESEKIFISSENKLNEIILEEEFVSFGNQIHRLTPDNKRGLPEHFDVAGDPKVTKGVVIYLNDNFDGGEIEYTNLGISIKPVPGMLVMHPGSKEYTHKVNPVSANRYMITEFVKLGPKPTKRSKRNANLKASIGPLRSF